MLVTMLLLLVMFIIYKLVTIATVDEGKLLKGKLVILSLSIMIGAIAGMIARPIITSIYKPLEAIVD